MRLLLLSGLLATLLVAACLLALRAVVPDPDGRSPGGRRDPAGNSLRRAPASASAPVITASPPDATQPAEVLAESGLTLGAGGAVLVVTAARSGVPVAGASIEVRREDATATALTGEDGRAEFADLAGGSYQLRVRMPPPSALSLHTPDPLELSEGERVELVCEVPEAGEIVGRVLDTDRQPVPGIQVETRPSTPPGPDAAFAVDGSPAAALSGPDGFFRLEGVALLEHLLTTRETPGHSSALAAVHPARSEPVEIIVAARKTLLIHGTVRDGRGLPVSGALISSPLRSGPPAQSDDDGSYRLEVRYERGAVGLSAAMAGSMAGERLLAEGEVEGREEVEADLLLEPKGAVGEVKGRLFSATDGKPVAGEVVLLHSSSLNASYQVRSAEDGNYAVGEVRPAEDYRIWVNPERSFRDYQLSPLAIGAETLILDIALEPLETGRLRGRMVDPDGVPVPWLTLWIRSQAAGGNLVALTGDAEGRFSSQEVPAGELVIESRAAPWIAVRGVQVAGGTEEELEISLGLGRGTLSGFVTDDLSRPVPRARLALTWSMPGGGPRRSTVYRETVSDGRGYFRLSGLARGRAVLHAAAPDFRDRSVRRNLTGGEEDVRIALTPAGN